MCCLLDFSACFLFMTALLSSVPSDVINLLLSDLSALLARFPSENAGSTTLRSFGIVLLSIAVEKKLHFSPNSLYPNAYSEFGVLNYLVLFPKFNSCFRDSPSFLFCLFISCVSVIYIFSRAID